jgi:membrane protein
VIDRARHLQERAVHTPPGRAALIFTQKKGPNWAVLLAWNALTAMFPILLLLIALLGFALGVIGFDKQALVTSLISVMPSDYARQETLDALRVVRQNSGIFFIFGLVSFVWTGSGLFSTMDQAFASVFGVPQRSFLPQKLMSIGMMLLFVVLVGATLLSSSVLPLLKYVPLLPGWLSGGVGTVALQGLLGVVAGVVLFGAIYFVVPNRPQRFTDVWPGALVAGVLFELLTLLFPVYLHFTGGGNTYGKTFGLFLLLLGYAYFLGLIVMLGASFNAAVEERAAFEGATAGVEHQARTAAAPAAAVAADTREPRQPWKSLMVLLAMIFGALLVGKQRRRPAAGG